MPILLRLTFYRDEKPTLINASKIKTVTDMIECDGCVIIMDDDNKIHVKESLDQIYERVNSLLNHLLRW